MAFRSGDHITKENGDEFHDPSPINIDVPKRVASNIKVQHLESTEMQEPTNAIAAPSVIESLMP